MHVRIHFGSTASAALVIAQSAGSLPKITQLDLQPRAMQSSMFIILTLLCAAHAYSGLRTEKHLDVASGIDCSDHTYCPKRCEFANSVECAPLLSECQLAGAGNLGSKGDTTGVAGKCGILACLKHCGCAHTGDDIDCYEACLGNAHDKGQDLAECVARKMDADPSFDDVVPDNGATAR